MRFALVLLLAACPAPPRARTRTEPRADGTCPAIAWSCVGVAPGATEAWGCTEGNAAQTARYEASCTADNGGRFALSPCLRDLAIGGCTLARGGICSTTWYHAPATRSDVERVCAREGAALVVP